MTATDSRTRLMGAPITPIVAPLWLGAERHGAELGAIALHQELRELVASDMAGPLGTRLGDPLFVGCPVPEDAEQHIDHRNLAFTEPIYRIAREHAEMVSCEIARGSLALTIGGDHALAFGSLAGAARTSERTGVIWLDTHPDLNTPASSPSGHMHGMPLATAIGAEGRVLAELDQIAGRSPMIDPADVVLLGVRDIDAGEREMILKRDIWTLTMEEWHDAGIAQGFEQALRHLTDRGVTAVHVSLDLDVLDPTVVPGTGTKMPGGLTYREASQVLRRLSEWEGPVHSFDMVELNPLLDTSGASTRIAGLLLATALGTRMLPPRGGLTGNG